MYNQHAAESSESQCCLGKSLILCVRECLSLLEQHAISYPTKLSQEHFPISAAASLL